ncbi:MAG: hypothetical protein QME51_00760, partial [Planctomycetota bacterium]|nr:hypothetical protein [Planctomycetota bacterium]
MKIAIYASENTGIAYWRVWNPAKYLRLGGDEVWRFPHKIIGVPLGIKDEPTTVKGRLIGSFERHGEWADLLVFQRPRLVMNTAIQAALRKTYNKPVIAEVDDDITAIHKSSPAYRYYKKYKPEDIYETIIIPLEDEWKFSQNPKIAKRIVEQYINIDEKKLKLTLKKEGAEDCQWVGLKWIKEADAVTVSTQALKELYSQYNKNIYVLPNSIDFKLWEAEEKQYRKYHPKKEKKNITIGWAGGNSHSEDTALITEAMGKVLKKYPNVRFQFTLFKSKELIRLWQEFPKQIIPVAGVPIVQWVSKFISQELDIGIAPLVDSQFNSGKSSLKFLEHSALKIPMVLSPVRPYLEAVKDSETGFFAETTDDWVDKLSLLIENEELRKG